MYRQFPFIVLASLIALVLGQAIQNQNATSKTLPACAVSCISDLLATSQCAPQNQTCLCHDEEYSAAVVACVVQTCTVKESLITKNLTDTQCEIRPRDISPALVITNLTLPVIAGLMVLLRLSFRCFIARSGLWADDWVMLLTLIVSVPGTIIIFLGTLPNGVGRDISSLSFNQITRFHVFFYIGEIQYYLVQTCLKLSVLLFYLRIFAVTRARYLLWGTIIFDILNGAGFIMLCALQCAPIEHFWLGWDQEHPGSCMNGSPIGWSNAVISIAMDLWMLALPLFQVSVLQLPWEKKIGVISVFTIGSTVTIFSIIRLQSIFSLAGSTNPTYDNYGVHLWSTLEMNVGMICACMPATRQLLVWAFPVISRCGNKSRPRYNSKGKRGDFNVPRSKGWAPGRGESNETVDNTTPAVNGEHDSQVPVKPLTSTFTDHITIISMKQAPRISVAELHGVSENRSFDFEDNEKMSSPGIDWA